MGTIKAIEQDFYLVGAEDGEVFDKIDKGSSIGIRTPAQTKNDKYYSPDMAINSKFTKVMYGEEVVIDILGDNLKAYRLLIKMRKYLEPKTNYLKKNNQKLKIIDMAKELNISKQACSKHFKILEKANLIAKIEIKDGKIWTMNPYYYMAGITVPKRVVDLFQNNLL